MNNREIALKHLQRANRDIYVAVGLLVFAVINNQRAADHVAYGMEEEVKRSSNSNRNPVDFDVESTAEEI